MVWFAIIVLCLIMIYCHSLFESLIFVCKSCIVSLSDDYFAGTFCLVLTLYYGTIFEMDFLPFSWTGAFDFCFVDDAILYHLATIHLFTDFMRFYQNGFLLFLLIGVFDFSLLF